MTWCDLLFFQMLRPAKDQIIFGLSCNRKAWNSIGCPNFCTSNFISLFFSTGREGVGGEGGASVSVQRERRAAAAAPAVVPVHGKRGPSGGEGSQEGEGDPGVEGETAAGGSGAGGHTLGEETLLLPQEPESGAGRWRNQEEVTVCFRTEHFQVYRNTRPGPGQVCSCF